MTTQNPAPSAATPSEERRVQPDGPLSGEVKRGGDKPSLHETDHLEVWSSLYEGYAAAIVVNRKGAPLRTLAEVRDYRDALLFAAAPALCAVLHEIIGTTDGFYTVAMPEALRVAANAAIAKAEGR